MSQDIQSVSEDGAKCLSPDSYHYPVSWCQPLYKPWDQYGRFEMVFIDKPRMTSLLQISYEKQWYLRPRVDINDEEEMKSLFSDDVFTVAFTSSSNLGHPLLKPQLCKANVLIGAVPYVHKLTVDKWNTYSMIKDFLKSYDMSMERLNLMPKSYLMSELMQSANDLQYIKEEKPNNMWLIKPRIGERGHGIEVIDSTLKLEQKLVLSDEKIVQDYIENLCLLEGRKFDVRAFVLIANTQPYILFYRDGYLRVSLKAYDRKASYEAHLTNTCIQSKQPDFSPDKHYWFYDKFQTYLDEHHPDSSNFVTTKLIPHIKKTALLLFHSGRH